MRIPHDCVARLGRLALLALLVLPGTARAALIVIESSNQDAFIQKNLPNRITGTKNTRLRVEAAPLDNRLKRALVQFPLGAIPPGSVVTSAVVELYADINARNPALRHGLHRITEPWQENAVKWNNAPEFATTPTATALVGNSRGFKAFDVTPDVQAAINLCSSDHGWLVKDDAENGSNDNVAYIAREESHPENIPNRPHLTVTFTPPACVTDADCQDTNLCTTNERCVAGACTAQALSCDDGNPCTADVCDCGQGCQQQPICNDGLSCTTDTCDPTTLECTNTPVDAACVTDCASGTCIADPDDPRIQPNTGCFIQQTEPPGTPCSDGEVCTAPDTCNDTGSCIPGPKNCDDPTCGTKPICSITPTPTPTATVTPTQTPTPTVREHCDNCIDDDQDGLIDRLDPKCGQLANGGGTGIGDPAFRGKRLVRCQVGIRTAGSKFANQLRTSLQKCSEAVFACLQQKGGDPVCLTKAKARCRKSTALLEGGPNGLEARFAKKLAKACGPTKPGLLPLVSGEDLCAAKGLGFESNLPACATPNAASLFATFSDAVAEAHRCQTVQLFTAEVPRAKELLTIGGVNLNAVSCLDEGAQGNGQNLGLGKPAAVLKAVVGCQRGIGTAGARFVKALLAAEQRCTELVAQCLQVKPDNTKCLPKAQKTCAKVTAKLYTGNTSHEAKLRKAIAKACGTNNPDKAPRVALADLRSQLGIGYDALVDDCAGLGVPGLASLDDVSECLIRQHVCRADQLLTNQTPRAHELLAIGGAQRR